MVTIIGGKQIDFPTALEIDISQNTIIIGESSSPSFPLIDPLSTAQNENNLNPIMLKIDNNGSIILSTYLTFLEDFSPKKIDIDEENNVILLGSRYQ